MAHMVELPDELFAKLQRHAVPLVDTPVSIIERALRALEAGDEDPVGAPWSNGSRSFNPAAPPDLKFTTVQKAAVGGKALKKADAYWNKILFKVIVEASARGETTEDILDLITVNNQPGRREDNGFTYIEAARLSIQGQDANSAWRQAYTLASSFGIELDVAFVWQDNKKAANPSEGGSFFVEGR
jgi:hypothetical protein